MRKRILLLFELNRKMGKDNFKENKNEKTITRRLFKNFRILYL